MKKIKIIVLIFCSILIFSSCNDVLNAGTDGRMTYDNVFSDNNLTSGYLNQCYSYMPMDGMNYATNNTQTGTNYPATNFLAVFTDEAEDADDMETGSTSAFYYKGGMTSNINPIEGGLNSAIYNTMYTGIRSCNVFIDHIDKATNLTVESNRHRWKAEAFTLRAFYFWHLVKKFGPLPIIKQDLPATTNYASITRPSFYECVKSIIQDCDSALVRPEFPWRLNMELDRGSMTKAVAMAIKSQAILFAASPQWNTSNDKTVWSEAVTITKSVLDSLLAQNFSLYNPKDAVPAIDAYSDYQRLFLLQPEMVESPAYDKETIYAQKAVIGSVSQNNGPVNTVKCGACPSQELVDTYETLNGMPVLDPTQPYLDADHLQPNYNTANTQYDKTKPYLNRDPRLLSTIYCNGSFYNISLKTVPIYTYLGATYGISQTNRKFTRTGYYLRKWANHNTTTTSNGDGYWRYFRLAEMWLNYAEAEFYANGVTANAVNALNQTRIRAGIPTLTTGITATEFEQRLRNERRVEFAFEEHRYYDVRRWNIQSQVDGVVTGMSIVATSPTVYTAFNRVVVSRRAITDPKYLLWPIPINEQLKFQNVGVTFQNPGW